MIVRSIFVTLVIVLLFGTSFCQNTTTLSTTPIPPKDTNWYVQNSNGTVCIAANLKAHLKVIYTDKNNKPVVNNVLISLNNESADSKPSTCDHHGLQVLAFTINDKSIKNLSLTFNRTDNNVYVTRLEVNINVTDVLFPNISKEALGKPVSLVSVGQRIFQVDNAHSYACDANQNYDLNVTQSGNLINKTEIVFKNVRIQGFINNKEKEDPNLFSTESNCKGSQNLTWLAFLPALLVSLCVGFLKGMCQNIKDRT